MRRTPRLRPDGSPLAGAGPRTLALYSGMAAAFPGMGRPLTDEPAAQRVLAEFEAASGQGIGRLVREAGEEELYADRSWELAVVAAQAAACEAFLAGGGNVSGALGFSIGAYAALLGARMAGVGQVVAMIDTVLEASRTLPGSYAMVAVTGPPLERAESLCRPGVLEVAAVLGEGQVIVAGRAEAAEGFAAAVARSALRVTRLPVRWPLHTTLMSPVADALDRRRRSIGRLRPPRHPVYSGLDGARITTPSEGWELLIRHLVRPQRFDLAMRAALADGWERIVDLGPGATLARVVRRLRGAPSAVESFPSAPARRAPGGAEC